MGSRSIRSVLHTYDAVVDRGIKRANLRIHSAVGSEWLDQKWETTLKHEHPSAWARSTIQSSTSTYGAREDGQSVDNKSLPPLPYAMIVTVAVEDTPGVNNNIRQRYQTLQPVEVR